MLTARETLEAALARSPDDMALHMAYADCLIEEGDPRGEWIRLCLEAEQRPLESAKKKQIANAKRRIERRYLSQWHGLFHTVDNFVKDRNSTSMQFHIQWKRGWIDHFQVIGFNRAVIEAFQSHPYSRLVRTFTIGTIGDVEGERVTDFAFLRSLDIPVVKRLTISDHSFNDQALEHLLAASFFSNVEWLSLEWCSLTDKGAKLLGTHKTIGRLKGLALEGNVFGSEGIAALGSPFMGRPQVFTAIPTGHTRLSMMNQLMHRVREIAEENARRTNQEST